MALPWRNPLIVALDVPDLDEAEALARRLQGVVGGLKVGLELYSGYGPEAVRRLGHYAPIFLDLKLHDIPTTVERAIRRLGGLGLWMLTVHAAGGPEMVAAAAGAAGETRILAVTVLTSLGDADLEAVGMGSASEQVPRLARLAVEAGAQGVVCAPRDLVAVRDVVGPDPVLVTPGIRGGGTDHDDHARGAAPLEALAGGADYLVVGRPVTRAADPLAAAQALLGELVVP